MICRIRIRPKMDRIRSDLDLFSQIPKFLSPDPDSDPTLAMLSSTIQASTKCFKNLPSILKCSGKFFNFQKYRHKNIWRNLIYILKKSHPRIDSSECKQKQDPDPVFKILRLRIRLRIWKKWTGYGLGTVPIGQIVQ